VHSAHEKYISLMMQSLGRQYVRYFNGCYGRSGTLWEGHYKCCLVQAEVYLLHLYGYIERNPVRAKMIEDPADYHWSSNQINGLGKESLEKSLSYVHHDQYIWHCIAMPFNVRQYTGAYFHPISKVNHLKPFASTRIREWPSVMSNLSKR
jgi:hypothetical protein